MDVNMPDGTLIQNVPDNISKADLLIKLHKNGHDISGYIDKPITNDFKSTLNQELDAHPVAANLASAGTALSDLYQGVKQTFGQGDKQAIENNNTIKEAHPLSAIAGNVGLYATGGVLAPVLNTVKGTTVAGTVMGGLAPTEDDNVVKGKLINAGLGGVTSLAGAKLGKYIGDGIAKSKADKLLLQSQNATRDASLKASQNAGYTIPRSLYDPSFMSNRLESIGGKAAIKQEAAMQNQQITNNLARKYLGIQEDIPLDEQLMSSLRHNASDPYRSAEQLQSGVVGHTTTKSMSTGQSTQVPVMKDGKQLVQQINEARDNVRALWTDAKSATGTSRNAARQSAKDAEVGLSALENQLDDLATQQGRTDIVSDIKDARKNIAKVWTIERALNGGDGNVSTRTLTAQLKKGMPLTGEAKTIANFGRTFPQVSQNGANIPASGVSKSEALASVLLGSIGAASTGGPGALAGLLPMASHVAKPLALSKMLQSTPSYGVGPTKKLAEALLASRYSPMAIAGATVPALSQ